MTETRREKGRFFVLDGVDGSGKSTQAALLVRRLTASEVPTPVHLRDPGSSHAGERIREVLLDATIRLEPTAQMLLFLAARKQMLEELIRPALHRGRDVVCDRFHASTFAYQVHAENRDDRELLIAIHLFCNDPSPDLTIVLDVDPELAAERRGQSDRFESRGPEYFVRVAEGYRRFAHLMPRVVVVPGAGPPEEVAERIWKEVER